MAAKLEEITAVFMGKFWPKPDDPCEFFMGKARTEVAGNAPLEFFNRHAGEFTIKCGFCHTEVKPQMLYRWYGKWESDPKYGDSFKVSTFTLAKPHSMAGVVKYLQECDGIGQATATAIWNKFRGDSVRILRENPEVVSAAVNRFPLDKAEAAAKKLAEMSAIEDTSIELIELLHGRGFPKDTARNAVKRWGNRAGEFIQRDPYILQSFRGIGFLKTDSMYIDLGLPPDRMKRQVYCAWHGIASDTEGNTWVPESIAVDGIKAKVSGTSVAVDPAKAISIGRRAGVLATRRDCQPCRGTGKIVGPDLFFGDTTVEMPCEKCGGSGGRLWLADARKARAEEYIARRVADMLTWESHWPSMDHPAFERLSEEQRTELAKATSGAIGSLGGSPGCGKTFSVAALARAIIAIHGIGSLAIACPTGKAAVRCKEAMGEYELPVEPKTIHRTLGVLTADGDGGGWSFNHKENNPLPVQFLIIDETSMCDAALFAAVLAAVGKGMCVLLVGDVNQLLPVGSGAPLRDLIAAGIPYGQLTKIHRNAGTIVRACAAIREQQPIPLDDEIELEPKCPTCNGAGYDGPETGWDECPTCGVTGKLPPRNLKLIAASKDSAPRKLLDLVREIRDAGQFDPIWGVQVCVAVNKRSALSRESLNKQLQDVLNPNGATVKGSPFRVNDKVICLKNSFMKLDASHHRRSGPPPMGFAGGSGRRPSMSLAMAPARSYRVGRLDANGDYDNSDEWDGNEGEDRREHGSGSGGADEKVLVCNGEFGRVLEVHANKTIVEFSSPRRVVLIPRGKQEGDEEKKNSSGGDDEKSESTGCDLSLGYACTTHKMQGSSAPVCIVVLDEYPGASGSHGICDRAWLYTAISRAEKVCYLIGKRSTMTGIVARQYITRRKTFLVERVKEWREDLAAGRAAKWEPMGASEEEESK